MAALDLTTLLDEPPKTLVTGPPIDLTDKLEGLPGVLEGPPPPERIAPAEPIPGIPSVTLPSQIAPPQGAAPAAPSAPRRAAPLTPEDYAQLAVGEAAPFLAGGPLMEEAGRGLIRGTLQIGEAAGTVLEAVGVVTGSEKAKSMGEITSSFYRELQQGFPSGVQGRVWDDPSLVLNPLWLTASVAETVPSLAVSIIPAIGTHAAMVNIGGRLLPYSPRLVMWLARLGASVTGGSIGGTLEGASTFQEVIQKGGTPEEATKAMTLMALASAGLNAISLDRLMGPAGRPLWRRILVPGVTEAVTEALEEPAEVGAIAVGAPSAAPPTGPALIEALKDSLNVIPPAFILGGLGGSIAGVRSEGGLSPEQDKALAEMQKAADEATKKADLSEQEGRAALERIGGMIETAGARAEATSIAEAVVPPAAAPVVPQAPKRVAEAPRGGPKPAAIDLTGLLEAPAAPPATPARPAPTQVAMPGLPRPEMPLEGIAPEVPQRELEETPLFGLERERAERAAREAQREILPTPQELSDQAVRDLAKAHFAGGVFRPPFVGEQVYRDEIDRLTRAVSPRAAPPAPPAAPEQRVIEERRPEVQVVPPIEPALAEAPAPTPAPAPELPAGVSEADVLDRLEAIARTTEDVRTSVEPGRVLVRDPQTGQVVSGLVGGRTMELVTEAFPEAAAVADVTPSKVVEAIRKDRENPIFVRLKEAVEAQLAEETAAGLAPEPVPLPEEARAPLAAGVAEAPRPAPVPPPEGEGYEGADRLRRTAEAFEGRLLAKDLPKDPREIRRIGAEAMGLTPTQLVTSPAAIDDIFDGLEVAINRLYRQRRQAGAPLANRVAFADRVERFLGNRTRTLEVAKRQQFSTPLTLAEAAAHALDLRPGDVVVEPTAGTGNLLAALPEGTQVVANEIDPRRAEALRMQGYSVTQADALRQDLRGTVVLMNSPWGKFTKRVYGKPTPLPYGEAVDVAERFFVSALRGIPEGGRIAAVMPTTVLRSPGFMGWLRNTHTLRAVVESPPRAYITRGTGVESVLLVVDKGRIPDAQEAVRGKAADFADLARIVGPLGPGGSHARAAAARLEGAEARQVPAGVPAAAQPVPERPARAPVAAVPAREEPRRAPAPLPSGEPRREPEARVPGVGAPPVPEPGRPSPGVVPARAGGPVPEPAGPPGGLPGDVRAGLPEPVALPGPALPPGRYSAADPAELDAASRSPVFAPAPLRSGAGENPHPRLVVKTRSLAGAALPELTYQPQGRLLPDAYRRKVISDSQWDYGIIPALQANQRGHGFLAASDVGVGKTRMAAAVAAEWLEGGADRVLYLTASDVNIQDVKREFDLYAGGRFPFEMVEIQAFKASSERRKKGPEPLPRRSKAVYLVDRFNLSSYRKAIMDLGFDAFIGDEAHLYKNLDAAVGQASFAIQTDVLRRRGKFLYLTATPATDFDDLAHLVGLREWAPDGFEDYKLRVTGAAAPEAKTVGELKDIFVRLRGQYLVTPGLAQDEKQGFLDALPNLEQPFLKAEERRERLLEAIDRLKQELRARGLPDVGADAEALGVTAKGRKAFLSGADVFGVQITPAEQEQIMRELVSKGKYDSVDLWRAGVEFEIQTNALTADQAGEYRRMADFFADLSAAFNRFGKLNKVKKLFSIRSFLQQEAKRRLFDYRLDHAIATATQAVARGEQPVISTISVNEGKETEGPIPAAINSINTREVEIDKESGEITRDEEIPEALVVRAELLERWAAFRTVRNPIEAIEAEFGRDNVATIIGATTPRLRERFIREFQGGARKVAVISVAGKTGISLHHILQTGGEAKGRRHMIVSDYEWSATMFKQELGRVDRSGQVSAPKITVLSTGAAGERKFLATVANRMRGLGALSKGSAESASNDKLAEFEIGGGLDTHAMRLAYREFPEELQGRFLSSTFRDPNDPKRNVRDYPNRAGLKDFLLDLQFMPQEDADAAFEGFWRKRVQVLAQQEAAEEAELVRTRTNQGEVLRSTALAPDLNLHEVRDTAGNRFGILQGIVTDYMERLSPHLAKSPATGTPIRRYTTFRAADRQISGLEIRPGAIAAVARRFGKEVGGRLDSPEAVLEALRAGDRVPLQGEAGYTLRMRRDARIQVDGAKIADRTVLMRHGATYSPVGNFFHVPEEKLAGFLERFPVRQRAEARPAEAEEREEGEPAAETFARRVAVPTRPAEVDDPQHRARRAAQQASVPAVTPALMERSSRSALRKKIESVHEKLASLQGARPVGVGRFRAPRQVLGRFEVKPEVIRTRVAEDVEILAHELGHHIQKHLFGALTPRGRLSARVPLLQRHRTELVPLATKPKAGGSPLPEGFAEFIRLYLTDQKTALAKAPEFSRDFEAFLEVNRPDLLAELRDFRDRYTQWVELPVEARIEATIARPTGARWIPSWDDSKEFVHRLYTYLLNEQHPFSRMVADYVRQSGQILPADKDPVILGATMRAVSKKGDAFINDGILEFGSLTVRPGSKSLRTILEPIAKDWKQWEAYARAKRAKELLNRGDARGRRAGTLLLQSAGLEEGQLDAYLSERERRSPAFRTAFDEYQEWNQGLLQYARDAGTLSRDLYDRIVEMNQQYVPWHVFFEPEPVGPGRGLLVGNVPAPTKPIKGTGRPIVSPIESAIRQAYAITNLAERASTGRALIELSERLEGGGRWARKVDRPLRPTTFRLEEIRSVLEGAGFEMPTGELEELATVFRPDPTAKQENVLTIWRKGERETWEVDPDLYRAMLRLDRAQLGPIGRILSMTLGWVTTVKRLAITLSPEFWVRNMLRDQQTLMAQAGKPPFVGFIKNFYEALQQGDLYREWEQAGGAQATLAAMDFKALEQRRKDVLSGKTKLENLVAHPWQILRIASELSEVPTRMAVFEERMQDPLAVDVSERARRLRAAFESREATLDFGRTGSALGAVRHVVAFLNPAMQGVDKLVRTHRDHPVRAMTVGFSLLVTSLLFRLLNEDDDEDLVEPGTGQKTSRNRIFDRIAQWQKDLFYIVITRNKDGTPTVWRIPKAFEWGFLYSTVFERTVLDPIFSKRPEVARNLTEAMGRTVGFNVIPDAALPVVESWANLSFFLDRPIVPRGLEELEPRYQYTSYTSETAKALGDLLNVSPAKVDHVLRLGHLGRLSVEAADELIRGASSATFPEPPTPTLADRLLIRALVARYPGTDAEPIRQFYDFADAARQATKTLSALEKQGRTDRAREYLNAHRVEARFAPLASKLAQDFGETRKRMNAVRQSGRTPDEKRWELDRMTLSIIDRADRFMDILERWRKVADRTEGAPE